MARTKRVAQAPGRFLFFLDKLRRHGEPVTRPRTGAACGRAVLGKEHVRIEVGQTQGEPERWPTRAGESEGCKRAMTMGNGQHRTHSMQRRPVSS